MIVPVAKLADVFSALAITPTSPVYTVDDPAPRTITHRSRSGSVNATQRATIDAHLGLPGIPAVPNPLLEGVRFADYLRDGVAPSPYPDLLAGPPALTTDPGTI